MLLYDLPLLLLSAVAQPLAALLPYGCGTPLAGAALPVLRQCGLITVYRCTHQCGERSNAAFGRQSAAVLPSLAPHDSKARLLSGRDSQVLRIIMACPRRIILRLLMRHITTIIMPICKRSMDMMKRHCLTIS